MTDTELTAVFCGSFLATLFVFATENIGLGWLAACVVSLLVITTDCIACTCAIWPATPDGVAGQPSFPRGCDACGRKRPTTAYPLCSLCDECITELGITVRPTERNTCPSTTSW